MMGRTPPEAPLDSPPAVPGFPAGWSLGGSPWGEGGDRPRAPRLPWGGAERNGTFPLVRESRAERAAGGALSDGLRVPRGHGNRSLQARRPGLPPQQTRSPRSSPDPRLFRFKRLKKQLNEIFPSRLVFVEERLPQSCEDFEVFVAGKLVHSKKGGDGYLDGYFNESKLVKVVAQIQEVLKDL
ncbi:selenoprotein V isoform 1-T1 [Sarcophilus harrisii]